MTQYLKKCLSEPFRICFIIALTFSCLGVLLWPAFFTHVISWYPAEAHARVMVFGFGGFMVLGFIGTALPRMLGASHFHPVELSIHVALGIAAMVCLFFGKVAVADCLIGLWILGWLKSFIYRFVADSSSRPPAGIVLVILSLVLTMLACFTLSTTQKITINPHTYQLCKLMMFQGFLFLPIMGISPFLLPRFFGDDSKFMATIKLTQDRVWRREFMIACLAAALFLGTFALEVYGSLRYGMLARAAIFITYSYYFIPGFVKIKKGNGLATSLRVVFIMCLSGWVMVAWLWQFRIAMLHLLFVSGLGLIMLSVATRVILGHNERHDRLASKMKWFHAVWSLLVVAALTRASADMLPKVRISHYNYAATLWVLVVIFWYWKIRKEIKSPKPPDVEQFRTRCTKKMKEQFQMKNILDSPISLPHKSDTLK